MQVDRLEAGLRLLMEAYDYARDAERGVWDFAVEVATLREAGFSDSDLRWLGCKDYVQYAAEITLPGEPERSFRPHSVLSFSAATCAVLTDDGQAFARDQCRHRIQLPAGSDGNNRHSDAHADGKNAGRPKWDAERLELTFEGEIVKRFKAPAPNQEALLAVFEEEDWPPRIDDPLTPQPEQDPKRRLLDTIKCLNRNQKSRLVRFLGDGTGQGVRWEPISDNAQGHQ